MPVTSQPRNPWNEPKRTRTITFTDTAWAIVSAKATRDHCSRSDVLERLVRDSYAPPLTTASHTPN